jgi:hypothetical protein
MVLSQALLFLGWNVRKSAGDRMFRFHLRTKSTHYNPKKTFELLSAGKKHLCIKYFCESSQPVGNTFL